MKLLASKVKGIIMISKTDLLAGLQIKMSLVEVLARQSFQMMKAITMILNNQIKEQSQIVVDFNKSSSNKVNNGKERVARINFGMMPTNGAKNSSNNKLGMILTNFSILSKLKTNKVYQETIQKVQI